MNFYCYNAEELIKKINIKNNNITFHKNFSHECNYFLKNITNFSKEPEKNSLYLVPIVIRATKQTSKDEIEECFYELVKNLKYFENHKNQHVFFWVGDSYLFSNIGNSENFFMQSCHVGSPCKALHYMSPLCKKLQESKDIRDTKTDISFQGNLKTHDCRKKITNILKLKYITKIVTSPCVQPQEQTNEWKESYIELIKDSKFILCPRGQGLNSIRFFESIAAGRIPILISNEVKLPLNNIIDWSSYVIHLKENVNYDKMQYQI